MSHPPSSAGPSPSGALRIVTNHPFEIIPLSLLRTERRNARNHSRAQVRSIARSIEAFGFNAPILIDGQNGILAGHGRYEAAKLLKLAEVPVVRLAHLNEQQARAYMLADNKLSDRSNWDDDKLAIELKEISDLTLDFEIDATGFEQAEIDLLIQSLDAADIDEADEFEASSGQAVSRVGDLWTLEPHRILCGNSIDEASYAILMLDEKAAATFTDAPYNCPINGHVRGKRKRRYREFAMATGELSERQFERFLSDCLANCTDHCEPGALVFAFMDWRHMKSMVVAGDENELQLINLCVWVKTNGGMGSMYRSGHELIFVFRNGSAPHKNNIQLGRFGRNRTNVWTYAGANVFGRQTTIDDFDSHPTVKPVRLVADALLDSTHRGDIVLDPFLGSGTTLVASERTGRRCFGIELDPSHVDTAVRRWERMTKRTAISQDGLTFDEVAARRTAGD